MWLNTAKHIFLVYFNVHIVIYSMFTVCVCAHLFVRVIYYITYTRIDSSCLHELISRNTVYDILGLVHVTQFWSGDPKYMSLNLFPCPEWPRVYILTLDNPPIFKGTRREAGCWIHSLLSQAPWCHKSWRYGPHKDPFIIVIITQVRFHSRTLRHGR